MVSAYLLSVGTLNTYTEDFGTSRSCKPANDIFSPYFIAEISYKSIFIM